MTRRLALLALGALLGQAATALRRTLTTYRRSQADEQTRAAGVAYLNPPEPEGRVIITRPDAWYQQRYGR